MKTGFWLEVVELAAHELIAERQSAPQLQPGATPQEIGCPGSGSAESKIQSLQRNSPSDSRFQRWAYCFHDPGALPQASGDNRAFGATRLTKQSVPMKSRLCAKRCLWKRDDELSPRWQRSRESCFFDRRQPPE